MFMDLDNVALRCHQPTQLHKIDSRTESVVSPNLMPLQPDLANITHDPQLQCWNTQPLIYLEIFVDNFLGLYQGTVQKWHCVC